MQRLDAMYLPTLRQYTQYRHAYIINITTPLPTRTRAKLKAMHNILHIVRCNRARLKSSSVYHNIILNPCHAAVQARIQTKIILGGRTFSYTRLFTTRSSSPKTNFALQKNTLTVILPNLPGAHPPDRQFVYAPFERDLNRTRRQAHIIILSDIIV